MNPTSSLPYAVVLGLDSMQGLQTARILARHGVPVIAVSSDPDHYANRTRVCEQVVVAASRQELFEFLETFGRSLDRKAVLVPCQDSRVQNVSRARDLLAGWYHILLPEADVVETLMDKTSFYRFAQEQGFPIPLTRFLSNESDARAAGAELTFPAVVKPGLRTSAWTEATPEKAIKVANPAELVEVFRRLGHASDPLIVQEWIDGDTTDLYSCNCYFGRNGEVLATFIARKIRQWPRHTGQSSMGEECRNDEVLDESIRLLRAVEYRGLGYVEMKRDRRTGKHLIVEPNVGRPTGRSAIAEAGGVDLLYTMYCDAVGLPLPDRRVQTYGNARWVHLRRDLLSAASAIREGELTWLEWARSMRGRKAYAVASWSDPMPFLAELATAIREAARLLTRRQR